MSYYFNKSVPSQFQQEFEALHSSFKPLWQRYKRDMKNVEYANQILKAVVVYNSGHIN